MQLEHSHVSVQLLRSSSLLSQQCEGTHHQKFFVAGDVLEQAIFLSVKLKDEAAFERNYVQLQVYYSGDARWATCTVLLSQACS